VYRSKSLLINNGTYIIKKVNGCELKVLLGEDWTRAISAKGHKVWQQFQYCGREAEPLP